jgi:MFS family permease
MLAILRSTWALLFGIALLMLGHGLQGTLLSVRATQEAFATATTGIVMSGYFLGLLLGAFITPHLVARVGHVRVFAAFSSIASTAILLHALWVQPASWFVLRVVTGVCLCGVYIVTESWLNGRADNQNRGRLFAVYMVILLGATALAQFLLNVADPKGYTLFILVSLLLSLSIVPILLSESPAPPITRHMPVSLAQLYRVSPLGTIGVIGSGLASAALYALGPVYAGQIGLTLAGISTFMAVAIFGGVVLQWPVGRLSDRFDRRTVLTATALLAAAAVAVAGLAAAAEQRALLFALFFVFGGLALPIYSLSVAHINDFLRPEQLVGASSTVLLANGAGAVVGPNLVGPLMQVAGPVGFILALAGLHVLIGGFALWRMTRRAAPPLEAQRPTIILPAQSAPAQAVAQEAMLGERGTERATA